MRINSDLTNLLFANVDSVVELRDCEEPSHAELLHEPPVVAVLGHDKPGAPIDEVFGGAEFRPGREIEILGFEDFFGNSSIGNHNTR